MQWLKSYPIHLYIQSTLGEDECGEAGKGLHRCWSEGLGWAMRRPSCPLQWASWGQGQKAKETRTLGHCVSLRLITKWEDCLYAGVLGYSCWMGMYGFSIFYWMDTRRIYFVNKGNETIEAEGRIRITFTNRALGRPYTLCSPKSQLINHLSWYPAAGS